MATKEDQLPLLSKTRYVYGVQCDKRLYLDCFRPELTGETSSSQQHLFSQGHEVGTLATRRYPGGVLIEYDRTQYAEAAEATARALADPTVPAIFEAAFEYAGVRIRVDILVRRPRGRWRFEEVKSSTKVADVHLHDLAVQLFVLEGCGLRVSEAGILHLDREYVRAGESIDVHSIFRFTDMRKMARSARGEIVTNLRRWRRQLALRSPPDVEPGRHCYDPYECQFTDHCIPAPGRFSLRRLPRHLSLIEAVGDSAPDDVRRLPEDARLTPLQARAVECLKTGDEYVAPELAAALDEVTYPIHFLDFETFSPAIPRYRRTRVYQALPFQWSDHVLHEDGRLEHREYLHLQASDPRLPFLDSLLDALGSRGTIVVYTGFEKTQLRSLADAHRRRRKRIRKVLRRLYDLHRVVRSHYYHPALDGSFSLKALVPALLPTLAYGAITDGNEAAAAYEEMLHPESTATRRAALERALRRYCRTDTIAMVKLLQILKRRARRREMA